MRDPITIGWLVLAVWTMCLYGRVAFYQDKENRRKAIYEEYQTLPDLREHETKREEQLREWRILEQIQV